jgi:uracil-DNA glycosylase
MMDREKIETMARDIALCRICVEVPLKTPLPHEPRPVVQLSSTARICIAGQAPGARVHLSGRPFTDPSGDRLRDWMGIGDADFYDPAKLAIVPMGFCFPGNDAKGGDLPPRKECALRWHEYLFENMPQVELLLAIGQYAQKWHLKNKCSKTLTQTVANWQEIINQKGIPRVLPLPHPSWRNSGWLKKNPWFTKDLLPVLKAQVQQLI